MFLIKKKYRYYDNKLALFCLAIDFTSAENDKMLLILFINISNILFYFLSFR